MRLSVESFDLSEGVSYFLTVCYRPNGGRPNPSPQLTIKGKWLEWLGFINGQPVSITAENGCLVIRPAVGD
ncbi:SymE family type I addiction module toxin [Ewingella sp. 20WA0182]